MKNKFENDFFESRDSWWSIQDQIEKHTDPNITQELRHIMELSLYNQRDMLLEIDKLKAEIAEQNKPKPQKTVQSDLESKYIKFNDRLQKAFN